MLGWAGVYLEKVCLATVTGEARAQPREDIAFWRVSKQHLLSINWCLCGSPRAMLRPPKERALSQSVQSDKTIGQPVTLARHSKHSRCHQGFQKMHALLFLVMLRPVLLILPVLLPKLAGTCLRKTALGAAQSNLDALCPR